MSEFPAKDNISLDYRDIHDRLQSCLTNNDSVGAERVINELAVEAASLAQLAQSVDAPETEEVALALSRGSLVRLFEINTLLEAVILDSELAEKRLQYGRAMMVSSDIKPQE